MKKRGGKVVGSKGVVDEAPAPRPRKGKASTDEQLEPLGRALSAILRHNAEELGIDIRSDGYCRLDEVLGVNTVREFSRQQVMKVVEIDNKSRFSTTVEDGVVWIRANQGHSMKVVEADKLLDEITSADDVPVCVHGTVKKYLPSILRNGLSKMSRNHVHLAAGLPADNGVISGMRTECDAIIFLDLANALKDGMKFFRSQNGVILSDGFEGSIPPRYFSQVLEWPSKRDLSIN